LHVTWKNGNYGVKENGTFEEYLDKVYYYHQLKKMFIPAGFLEFHTSVWHFGTHFDNYPFNFSALEENWNDSFDWLPYISVEHLIENMKKGFTGDVYGANMMYKEDNPEKVKPSWNPPLHHLPPNHRITSKSNNPKSDFEKHKVMAIKAFDGHHGDHFL
ncbi:hypothetical protein ACJX0J_036118, partial [Zea mays]